MSKRAEQKQRSVKRTLLNVEEYARMFAFALTEHDQRHQDHAAEMTALWCERLIAIVKPPRCGRLYVTPGPRWGKTCSRPPGHTGAHRP